MSKSRSLFGRNRHKSEAAQDSGDEVSLQTSRSSPKTGKSPSTSKKKKKNSSSKLTFSTSLGDDVSQLGTHVEHHFGQDPPYEPKFPITDHKVEPKYGSKVQKARTWGGSRIAKESLSSSSGSSLLGGGFQRFDKRLISNSKEDQAKRQAYRPASQRKALQVELEQVKKERDDAKQELANERDRNVKLEQECRESKELLLEVSDKKREVLDLKLKIKQCKCGKTPLKPSDHTQPECDEGVNYRSLPESNAGEGSGEVGQQCRSYQSFEESTPDRSKVDTLMKLHLEEKLKKKDLDIVQLNQTNCDLEQKLTTYESTCDQARPHESVQLESLREQVKTMESAVQQKEETITQLTKECAKLKEELEKQEADHDLQVLTVQENLTQALKTNEALNLEVQQLRTSQSEQVELRMKLMKQHASDLDVKRQEIDALKKQLKDLQMKHVAQVSTLEEKLFNLQKEEEEAEAKDKQLCDTIAKMHKQIKDQQNEIETQQTKLTNYPGQIAILKESANKEVMKLSKELNAVKDKLNTAREELDAAKVEIDARLQHEMKITKELRASNEEKSRLQDQLQAVQFQVEGYEADFHQERKDRATAAGQYDKKKEQMETSMQDWNEELKKKTLEHQQQVLSEQYRDSPRTVEELKEEQQPSMSQSIQSLRAVGEKGSESMANAVAPIERRVDSEVDREAYWKQTRIDQLEGKLGECARILSELRQHPQEHIHYIIPPDAYRHNASDKMTRSSSDSSLEQSMSNLPRPLSKVRPVLRPTISPVPTKGYSSYWYTKNMHGETTNGFEVDGPTLPHNRDADRDGITQEIREKAEELKKPPKGLSVADDVDEKLWPYDPNLVCPHCGKRFRHGQIREFRFHIDDEHSPSLM